MLPLLLLSQVVVYILQALEMVQIVGQSQTLELGMASENMQILHRGVTLAYVLYNVSMFWNLNITTARTEELFRRVQKLEGELTLRGRTKAWVGKHRLEPGKVTKLNAKAASAVEASANLFLGKMAVIDDAACIRFIHCHLLVTNEHKYWSVVHSRVHYVVRNVGWHSY